MSQLDDDILAKMSKNWTMFTNLCSGLGERSQAIKNLLDHFGDRLALAPASSRDSFHNAFPGGLIDHSIRVLKLTMKLCKAYEVEFSKESIIISALFHDLGKVGNLDEDHYLPEDSDWHRKQGKKYKHNSKLQFMSTAHRAVYLLQHFGVQLTESEFLAIMLNDGPEAPENVIYSMKEPTLAVIIHQADRMACEFEKYTAKTGDE